MSLLFQKSKILTLKLIPSMFEGHQEHIPLQVFSSLLCDSSSFNLR